MWKSRRIEEGRARFLDGSYEADGVFYWNKSGRPIPVDFFADHLIEMSEFQQPACEKATKAFFAEYRKNYKGPSDEERFEARAAFGPGVEIVNVITGTSYIS